MTYTQARDRAAETYGINHRHITTATHFADGSDFGAKYVLESAAVRALIEALNEYSGVGDHTNEHGMTDKPNAADKALAAFNKFKKDVAGE